MRRLAVVLILVLGSLGAGTVLVLSNSSDQSACGRLDSWESVDAISGDPSDHSSGQDRASSLGTRIMPTPAGDPDDSPVILDVCRKDGRPIADAEIRATIENFVLEARTDAGGHARLWSYPQTTAEVAVSRADFMTELQQVTMNAGRHRFVVPTRSSVVGHVTVNGKSLAEPLLIGFESGRGGVLSAKTDADDRIEFFNLPADWTGCFRLPSGYRRAGCPFPGGLPTVYEPPRPTISTRRFRQPNEIAAEVFLASQAVLGVPGDVQPEPASESRPSAEVQISPDAVIVDEPRGTLVPETTQERTVESPADARQVYDVGWLDLARQIEVRLRVIDVSGRAVVGAGVWIGWTYWSVPAGVEDQVFTVDEQVTDGRTSITNFSVGGAFRPIDDVAIVRSGAGPTAVTVRVSVPDGVNPR